MSSTRSRNKFCLSLDNSSRTTSSATVHLNRWSEVVPPKTALTFAALWDPQEGMVTFSGAALLEEGSSEAPHPDGFDDENLSQIISVDRESTGGTMTHENTATLATFQDTFKAFLYCTPLDAAEQGQGTPRRMQARASSTFDGLDVYSHDFRRKSKGSIHLSCMDLLDMESSFCTPSVYGTLRLRSDLMPDSCRSESESDAAPASRSRRPSQLKSRFSMTTSSTSNYVDIPANAPQDTRAETPPILEWIPPKECASPAGSWPYLPPRRRLLRKRRPLVVDATATLPSTPKKLLRKSSMSSSRKSLGSPSPFATLASSRSALALAEGRRGFSVDGRTTSLSSPPKKLLRKSSMSSSPGSISPSATLASSRTALALGEDRRARRPVPIGVTAPISPTITSTPPTLKSPRLRLLAFLPRRKSRQQPSSDSDSDGWVCIDVTPVIRQRFIPDMDEDH